MVSVDPGISFTTTCLFEALVILLERKDFNTITVKEVCSLAGVSRSTYYRNFSDLQSIVSSYFLEHATNAFSIEEQTPENYLALVHRGLAFCENHKKALITLANANNVLIGKAMFDMVSSVIKGYYTPMVRQLGFSNSLEVSGLMGAVFMVEVEWIRGGMRESRSEVADAICKVVNHRWLVDSLHESSNQDKAG